MLAPHHLCRRSCRPMRPPLDIQLSPSTPVSIHTSSAWQNFQLSPPLATAAPLVQLPAIGGSAEPGIAVLPEVEGSQEILPFVYWFLDFNTPWIPKKCDLL